MNVAVLSIVASALTAIVISVIGVLASRKKDDAQANALTSTEWKKLYDEMCRRIEKLEARLERQDMKLDKMDNELDLAKDRIQYLWLGTLENIKYIQNLDSSITLPFHPEINFRGDVNFDYEEWDWLGDRNK